MPNPDMKTAAQVKIGLKAMRLHGHIITMFWGFALGFLLCFWFGLSPRPLMQITVIEYLISMLMHWLGALSYFPRLLALYNKNAGADLFLVFYHPLLAGVILAPVFLLVRFHILNRVESADEIPHKPETVMRGLPSPSQSDSLEEKLSKIKD